MMNYCGSTTACCPVGWYGPVAERFLLGCYYGWVGASGCLLPWYWWFVVTSGPFQGASDCICEVHGSK